MQQGILHEGNSDYTVWNSTQFIAQRLKNKWEMAYFALNIENVQYFSKRQVLRPNSNLSW